MTLARNPKARLVAYLAGLACLLILSVLLGRNVIDKQTATSIYDVLEIVLSLFGVSVTGLAAKVLGHQMANGTLAISGTADEQLAKAAQQYAEQTAAAKANVAQAQTVLTSVLQSLPGGAVIASTVDDAIASGAAIVDDVVIACGDALR
jgi:hypothetical protein